MRIIVLGIIMLISNILDNSMMPFLSINHGYGSLLLVFMIAYTIQCSRGTAVIIGICTGLLQDLYFGNVFGINTLINMLICIICSELGNIIIKRKKIIPIMLAGVISIVKGLFIYGIMFMLKYNSNIYTLIDIAICNMILMFIIYKLVYKLSIKPFMKNRWNFKKETE